MGKMVQAVNASIQKCAGWQHLGFLCPIALVSSLASTAQVGPRATGKATALAFKAHSELWKSSPTLLQSEITGTVAARRLQKSNTERCVLT